MYPLPQYFQQSLASKSHMFYNIYTNLTLLASRCTFNRPMLLDSTVCHHPHPIHASMQMWIGLLHLPIRYGQSDSELQQRVKHYISLKQEPTKKRLYTKI